MKEFKLGLIGYGTVGQGVKKILDERNKYLESVGAKLTIEKVAARNLDKKREVPISRDRMTDDPKTIVDNPDIDIVVEVMGGVEESYDLLSTALKNKKHVVTANKAVVSAYFEELTELADQMGVMFLYEASVAGGIPAIKPLYNLAALNDITQITGILNGTSNYILSKMTLEGADYADVLKEAQDLGYAEADPYEDVEGVDAMRKLRILASIAYNQKIAEESIIREGISNIGAEDIEILKDRDYVVKLLADSTVVDGNIQSTVQPTAIKDGSYYSVVNDAYNNVSVTGDMVGEIRLYGAGAGMLPTAHAVLSDCIDIALDNANPYQYTDENELDISPTGISGTYYVRTKKNISDVVAETIAENVYITKDVNFLDLKASLDQTDPIIKLEV